MGLTFASVGIAHIVGGTIGVIVWVGSGSIHSNKLAPVHLRNVAVVRRINVKDYDYGCYIITSVMDRRDFVCVAI